MSKDTEYLNDVPEGYDGPRCQYAYKHEPNIGKRCGLPAWEGATESAPYCEFHSEAKPDDIKQRLENAVLARKNLAEAKLSGLDLKKAKLELAALSSADLSLSIKSDRSRLSVKSCSFA